MGIEPHVNKPPRTSQVADGFTQQKFLGYLVEEVIDSVTEPPNLQEINYEKLPPKQLL